MFRGRSYIRHYPQHKRGPAVEKVFPCMATMRVPSPCLTRNVALKSLRCRCAACSLANTSSQYPSNTSNPSTAPDGSGLRKESRAAWQRPRRMKTCRSQYRVPRCRPGRPLQQLNAFLADPDLCFQRFGFLLEPGSTAAALNVTAIYGVAFAGFTSVCSPQMLKKSWRCSMRSKTPMGYPQRRSKVYFSESSFQSSSSRSVASRYLPPTKGRPSHQKRPDGSRALCGRRPGLPARLRSPGTSVYQVRHRS